MEGEPVSAFPSVKKATGSYPLTAIWLAPATLTGPPARRGAAATRSARARMFELGFVISDLSLWVILPGGSRRASLQTMLVTERHIERRVSKARHSRATTPFSGPAVRGRRSSPADAPRDAPRRRD